MAAVVLLVWLLSEQKKIAKVYLIPVDGELMAQDWDSFQLLVDSLHPFAILLEPDTLGQQPEFGRLIGPDLSAKLKNHYPDNFQSITPDSLYQKAFATSIRKSVDKLDELSYHKLIQWENITSQLRKSALFAEAESRDSLLEAHHLGREAIFGPHFVRLPNRYAGLLMRNIGELVLKHPDQNWIILIDIEKFSWLKARLLADSRIEVLNELEN